MKNIRVLVSNIINKFKGLSVKKKILIGGLVGVILIGAVAEEGSTINTSDSIANNTKTEQLASNEVKEESKLDKEVNIVQEEKDGTEELEKIKSEQKAKEEAEKKRKEEEENKAKNQEKINDNAKALILKKMKDNFEPDGMKVSATSKEDVYMINITPVKGTAMSAIYDVTNNGGTAWNNIKDIYIDLSKGASDLAEVLGSNLTFAISILNDSNVANTLLTVSNGQVIYDFSEK